LIKIRNDHPNFPTFAKIKKKSPNLAWHAGQKNCHGIGAMPVEMRKQSHPKHQTSVRRFALSTIVASIMISECGRLQGGPQGGSVDTTFFPASKAMIIA
jgi:hypothetical protein